MRQWSYRQLAEAANRLAVALRRAGIGRGAVVAIAGPRSFGLVSSMLGIWSCGGAFLTVDPALPEIRRRTMLQEARVKAVCRIGKASVPEDYLDTLAQPRLLDIDPNAGIEEPSGSAQSPASEPPRRIGDDDPAYVFFTSGTTGAPKGVLGCHRGISHFLDWQRQTFGIDTSDRVAQLTSLSFDVLLRDVFLPLTSGATLCLPEDADLANPLAWLARERVTVVHAVPTLPRGGWRRHQPPRACRRYGGCFSPASLFRAPWCAPGGTGSPIRRTSSICTGRRKRR